MPFKNPIRGSLLKALAIFTSATLSVFCIIILFNDKSNSRHLNSYTDNLGIEVAQKLNAELYHTKKTVDSLSYLLKTGQINHDTTSIKKEISTFLEKCGSLNGVFIAFENYSKEKPTFSPYTRRTGGRFITSQVDKSYDYVNDTIKGIWYHKTKNAQKPIWLTPYYGYAGKKRFVSYLVPITINDSLFCVLGVDYNSMDLFHMLSSWKVGRVGFPYLINRKSEFLAHPYNEILSLKQLGEIHKEIELIKISDALNSTDTIINQPYYHVNTITNSKCWEKLFYVREIDCFLGIVVDDTQLYSNPQYLNEKRRHKIKVSLIFLTILLIYILFHFNYLSRFKKSIRLNIIIICVLISLEIILTYHYCVKYQITNYTINESQSLNKRKDEILNLHRSSQNIYDGMESFLNRWNFSMLLDNKSVSNFIQSFNKSTIHKGQVEYTIIPTGIFLQTIKFSDSHTTKITGYAWQTYSLDCSIEPGLIFPDAEEFNIELVDSSYIFKPDGSKVKYYKWHFKISILESFDYTRFPFDRNNLWLRMRHEKFDQNVILVPDFNSYLLIYPAYKPGLDNSIIINGWKVEGSYFSYKETCYNSNFGSDYNITKQHFPELHYNIILLRDYSDSVITKIIPLSVLLFILFSILYISKKEDSLNVIIAVSGLFFVAIFEHIHLRRSLNVSGIIYLGYYYFITYFLLMLVSLAAVKNDYIITIGRYQISPTQLLKILFWPLSLTLLLAVTIYTYY